jgi:hypothetical protein
MFKLTYCLNETYEFRTFAEAFSVLYKKLKEDSKDGFPLQILETAIWIQHGDRGSPLFIYDIVDRAKRYGLLENGELNEENIKKEMDESCPKCLI